MNPIYANMYDIAMCSNRIRIGSLSTEEIGPTYSKCTYIYSEMLLRIHMNLLHRIPGREFSDKEVFLIQLRFIFESLSSVFLLVGNIL